MRRSPQRRSPTWAAHRRRIKEDVIERPMWALATMGGGRLQLVHHLPPSSLLLIRRPCLRQQYSRPVNITAVLELSSAQVRLGVGGFVCTVLRKCCGAAATRTVAVDGAVAGGGRARMG